MKLSFKLKIKCNYIQYIYKIKLNNVTIVGLYGYKKMVISKIAQPLFFRASNNVNNA